MKSSLRRPLALALALSLPMGLSGTHDAVAQGTGAAWPTKTIRLVVPFTPGGSQDVLARVLGQKVGDALGQRLLVDNRPGAGGLIAAQESSRANPDGYTLFLSSGAQIAIAPGLRPNLGYDPIRDFVHVIHLVDLPLVLIAHPGLPVSGVKELVAYAKANPGKVSTASTGTGTYTHLTTELMKSITGAPLTHVPYKGAAPALNDLVGRQVETMFTTTASAQPFTSTQRVKALGITAPRRSAMLPEVPTFGEQGVSGLNVSSWIGISVPAKTPQAVVERLAREFARALEAPDVRERLATLGVEIASVSGEPFAKMVREDQARWSRLIKSAGIKVE
ncbi:MAG: Bug family tripartite tricarboxylate transporter substrate binding protein [bacterium]|jgi:tripartite-type tricarboxylate transporter receptor subunit TctC|nr:tripartite tricarboxylate transporter substrate binding protein [Betaproteobacteria bacterium]